MRPYSLLLLGLLSSASLANQTPSDALLFGIPPSLANFAPAPSTDGAKLDVAVSELIDANGNGGLMDMDVPRLDTAHTYHIAWEYGLEGDEFTHQMWRQARLVSNDYNVSMLISFDKKDKHLKAPNVFLVFSGDWDNGVHSPLCDGECVLDMTINGHKLPNVPIRFVSTDVLQFTTPTTLVSELKTAHEIKLRVQSVTGQHLIYRFTPSNPLALSQLR